MTDEHPEVHPTATIGTNTTVGAGTEIAANVTVGNRASIGARSSIGPSVYLAAGTTVGDDVVIGPNTSVVGPGFGRATDDGAVPPTSIGDGASIGANVAVLAGVTIGPNAVIGAGSVITGDVPPYATAVGVPARIVGYQSSPGFTASRRLRASSLADDEFPLAIGRATLSRHPLVTDMRGSLTFGELPTNLPFSPQRFFLVFDVPSREVRGEHAHHELHQLLICVRGECVVALDDGIERGEVVLDRPDAALHLPPMVWGSQYRYSPDAALLVLASAPYDADDYIRSYAEFQAAVRHE